MNWKIIPILGIAFTISSTTNALPTQEGGIKNSYSLLIRNKNLLNEFSAQYNMGYLLGEVGMRELKGSDVAPGGFRDYANMKSKYQTQSVGHYVYRIFDMAHTQQLEYNQYYKNKGYTAAKRLGQDVPEDMTMAQVFRAWKMIGSNGRFLRRIRTEADFIALKQPYQLRSNKFRLLGIVNRMDLADNFDPRKTGSATDTPRYLGEIHVVYGLVDERNTYEDGTNPKPFPMTFSISYRLPAINYSKGKVTKDESNPDLTNESIWKHEIGEWAKAWAKLSDYETPETPAYKEHLKSILNIMLRPKNFIGLRSNTQIKDNEFELREWYIFRSAITREDNEPDNNVGQLIPRKPRMEPYECLDGSRVLTSLVDHYWQGGGPTIIDAQKTRTGFIDYVKKKYNDLDVHTKYPDLAVPGENDQYRAGMLIPREKERPYFYDTPGPESYTDNRGYNTTYIGHDNTRGRHNYYWKSSSKCGKDMTAQPFAMLTGPGRNQAPLTKSWDDAKASQLMMLAPFGRVKKYSATAWGRSWKVSADENYPEMKRHAFSIRTCTGCHGQEGSAAGFHIYPRLADQKADASGFLTGNPKSSPVGLSNIFTKRRGTTSYRYKYNELNKRRSWIWKFMKGTEGEFIRYRNLVREDL